MIIIISSDHKRRNWPRCNNVALPFLHSDIHRGGLQFHKISNVAKKYVDALSSISHDAHTMLSRIC